MIRKKGLFWYDQKKRLFDWSAVLSGATFGYNNPWLSHTIKNHYKKSAISLDATSSAYIKSQLSFWSYRYPQLQEYDFFLLDNLDLFFALKGLKVSTEPLELNQDIFLHHLKKNSDNDHPKSQAEESGEVISDLYWFNHQSTPLPPQAWFYMNSHFPLLTALPPFFPTSKNRYPNIIVGGTHPWQINGQKLVLIHKDNTGLSRINPKFNINLWHLEIYTAGINYYFNTINSKHYLQKATMIKNIYNQILEWSEKKKNKIEITSIPDSPLYSKVRVYKNNNQDIPGLTEITSKKTIKNHNNRLWFGNTTIIYQEKEKFIDYYLFLPVTLPTQHLENKWKQLVELFSLVDKL